MMRTIKYLIILLQLTCGSSQAAIYYVCDTGATCGSGWSTGSDTYNGTSKSTPKKTIGAGMSAMAASDTLVVGDGVYTGASNMINPYAGGQPKSGTAEAWTVIRAENDGGVLLNGGGTVGPILLRGSMSVDGQTYTDGTQEYIEIRGFVATGSDACGIDVRGSHFIKIINCGAYDAADGNTYTIGAMYSEYILFEGCYAWGGGRYKIGAYHSHYTIFRNCVARNDWVNAAGDPSGDFAIYSSRSVEVQNSIAIDGDDPTKWTNVGEYIGAFGAPTTSSTSYTGPINFRNVIALNNYTRFASSDNNSYSADVHFYNSVGWDLSPRLTNGVVKAFGDLAISQSTLGDIHSSATLYDNVNFLSMSGANKSVTNSIITGTHGGGLFANWETVAYNNIYDTGTISIVGTTPTNTLISNPISNGLRHLPRVESGSSLLTAGSGGVQVGATIMYQVGVSGTLWGETGYATLTTTPMWPYPNQDLIKSKMAEYSNHSVTGARGFAATGKQLNGTDDINLTSYIWEYLGNPLPSDMYPPTSAGLQFGRNGLISITPGITGGASIRVVQ